MKLLADGFKPRQAFRRDLASFLRVACWGAAALITGLTAAGAHGHMALFGGITFVVLCAAPSLVRLQADRVDAVGIYALVSVFSFGLTSIAWLGTPLGPGPRLTQTDIGRGLALVGVALLGLWLGSRVSRFSAPPVAERRQVRPAWLLVGAYVLSLAGVAVGMLVGTYGYDPESARTVTTIGPLSQVVTLAPTISGMVVLAAVISYFAAPNHRRLVTVLSMVLCQAGIGFAVGVKAFALEPLALAGVAFVMCRGYVPWKAFAGLVLVTLLVIIPVTESYRQRLQVKPSPSTSKAMLGAVTNPANLRVDRSVNTGLSYVFQRYRQVDHVALIVRDTPNVFAYGSGDMYTLLPLIVTVPRAVWKDKPVLDVGLRFSYTYWEIPKSIKTVTQVTQVGDLYRNFGVWGTFGGMVAWGAFLAGWAELRRRRSSLRVDTLYAYSIVLYVVYLELNIPELLAAAAKGLPVLALIAVVLLPARHHGSTFSAHPAVG